MITAIGEYRGLGAGGYGRVHISRFSTESPLTVTTELDADEWNDQLRDGQFNDWLNAAEYGIRFALEHAGIAQGRWNVDRVVGLLVDTNPVIVAVAAARATWNAAGIKPPEDLDARLQLLAKESSSDDQPDFD